MTEVPTHTPSAVELADLELLLAGALAPLTGFLGQSDLSSMSRTGKLADGTTWSVPVTLTVPSGLAEHAELILTDPEGAPLATVTVTERWPVREGRVGIAGPVRRTGDGGRPPFARLHRPAADVRGSLGGDRVVGFFADRVMHRPQIAQVVQAARSLAADAVVLIPVGTAGPDGLAPEALIRCILAANDRLNGATIVAVPLPHRGNEIHDALLRSRVAAAYGVTHLLAAGDMLTGGGPRVIVSREFAYDARDGQWRWRDDVPDRFQRDPLTSDEINDMLDDGVTLPEWHTPPAVARELARARPSRRHRGLVVFFTGLSGSGKSTIAHAVADEIRESGTRSVTLLDGDVVRRELSAGLTFSKADRDLNIRRIGWVAAEVGRHGGIAICCPIAPYAGARATARAMARSAGADFLLVHVSTPLEVCEARDRKGLYAKARAGLITGMTGIDDPYEVPTDAELRIDTSTGTIDDGVKVVLNSLIHGGWLPA
ncbi:sulfate adenylyltransferase [Allocatelliglobosispora scoriae]|uniref:Adenylyl-sulfate kinase n=1 Tax=Allocatelliglobosispora scoriae TaxID=643052 RepID=A0A841BVW7_9ACTN|nr:adenylyl-sulfate kinase [Allocatelliglobosispora scoriae]MBB5871608.1 sulfate adenylyltransferase [Allocatelliglobosispora scoriae]